MLAPCECEDDPGVGGFHYDTCTACYMSLPEEIEWRKERAAEPK